jgi:hypothetical protein
MMVFTVMPLALSEATNNIIRRENGGVPSHVVKYSRRWLKPQEIRTTPDTPFWRIRLTWPPSKWSSRMLFCQNGMLAAGSRDAWRRMV